MASNCTDTHSSPGTATGRRFAAAALAGLFLLAAPAQAQGDPKADEPSALAAGALKSAPMPPRSEDDIVVTGKKAPEPAEVRKQAHSITPTALKYRDPIAMFQDRVCPGIVGMPAELAEMMVDRIRYNADRVGLETAPIGECEPNILVIFVRNGQAVIQDLKKNQGYIFKSIPHDELNAMAQDSGPVHAWVNRVIRSRYGDELQGDLDKPGEVPTLNVGSAQSRIINAHRLDITNSVILIDIPAINQKGIVQLADYVTMRVFVQTRPVSGESAAGTILNLFDKDEATVHPYELTDFDLAYLRAVYDGWDSLNAASKIASINRKLRDIQEERLAAAAAK